MKPVVAGEEEALMRSDITFKDQYKLEAPTSGTPRESRLARCTVTHVLGKDP